MTADPVADGEAGPPGGTARSVDRRHCAPKGLARRLLEGCGAPVVTDHAESTGRAGAGLRDPALTDRRERHRLLIDAVLPDMAEDTVVSHQSAAVLYGATVWRAPLDRVCVTRNRRGGGRTRPYAKVHGSPVDSAAEIDGLLVTTPARTVVDLALTLPFEAAVVAGDTLVGAFGLTTSELTTELSRAKCRHGIGQAKRVIALLDGRSQSVGESLSRIMIQHAGLPSPRSQGNVLTPDGRFVGRVDFYYEDSGVLCEFDGPLPYGRLLPQGHRVADTLRREQTRETYLRALGFQVVRWTWNDLRTDEAARRLRAALTQPHSPPDGRIEPAPAPEPRRITTRAL